MGAICKTEYFIISWDNHPEEIHKALLDMISEHEIMLAAIYLEHFYVSCGHAMHLEATCSNIWNT